MGRALEANEFQDNIWATKLLNSHGLPAWSDVETRNLMTLEQFTYQGEYHEVEIEAPAGRGNLRDWLGY